MTRLEAEYLLQRIRHLEEDLGHPLEDDSLVELFCTYRSEIWHWEAFGGPYQCKTCKNLISLDNLQKDIMTGWGQCPQCKCIVFMAGTIYSKPRRNIFLGVMMTPSEELAPEIERVRQQMARKRTDSLAEKKERSTRSISVIDMESFLSDMTEES